MIKSELFWILAIPMYNDPYVRKKCFISPMDALHGNHCSMRYGSHCFHACVVFVVAFFFLWCKKSSFMLFAVLSLKLLNKEEALLRKGKSLLI
jgi:hypothetical protein